MCYLMLLRESRLTGSSEAPIELVWKLSARFGAVFKIRSNLGRVEGTGFHLRRSSWLKRELNLPGSLSFQRPQRSCLNRQQNEHTRYGVLDQLFFWSRGRAYSGGRGESVTRWRPAATRAVGSQARRRRSPAHTNQRRGHAAPSSGQKAFGF